MQVWLSWFVVVAFYAYQYILRVIPNILIPYIQGKLHIDGVVFGQFSGVYYTGYALFHIPAGFLVARYGLKLMLPAAVLLTALGAIPITYTNSWTSMIIGRICTGVGSSFAPIAAFYLLSEAFPSKKFGRLLGTMVSIGLAAAIYAGAPLAHFVENVGAKHAIDIITGLGIVMALLSFCILKSSKGENHVKVRDIWTVLSNYKITLTALAAGLMVGTLEGFPDAWGARFLSMKYNLSMAQAAPLTSCIFLGMLVGCPLCSWLASYKDRYMQTIIGLGVVMSGVFLFILLGPPLPYKTLSVLFTLMGVCCGYQIPALFVASKQVPHDISVLSTTIFNMVVMVFGHIIHTIVGLSVEAYGGINDLNALEQSLTIIPVICIIGTSIFFKLKRKVLVF